MSSEVGVSKRCIPGKVNHPPVVQDGLTEFGTVLGDTDGLSLI